MRSNSKSKSSSLLIGLGAVSGLVAVVMARKETREAAIERATKSVDYLNKQSYNLGKAAGAVLEMGKKIIARWRSDAPIRFTEADRQAHEQEKREHLGG